MTDVRDVSEAKDAGGVSETGDAGRAGDPRKAGDAGDLSKAGDASNAGDVDAYLALLAAFRHPDVGEATPDLGALALVRRVFGAGDAAAQTSARLLAALPGVPDPFAAGALAVQLGSMVERGTDPGPLGDALVARLPGDFAAARRFAAWIEAQHGVEEPDKVEPALVAAARRHDPAGGAAWAALQLATMAAMAAWCRHPASRRAAAAVPGFTDDAVALGRRGGYSYFIGELLRCADGRALVVLAPSQRQGFVVELEAVRNAAHLFALLEATLVGDGRLAGPRLDPAIEAIARGERPDDGRSFSIGWHYEYWFGVRPEAHARQTGLHPLIAAMIGVEASVTDLPAVRGHAVILMKPRLLGSRGCDTSFFSPLHDALRSATHVRRTLTGDEVDAWLAELEAEAGRAAAS